MRTGYDIPSFPAALLDLPSVRGKEKEMPNILLKLVIIAVCAVVPALASYMYGLFNDLSHFSITQVYYSSVYAYLIGSTLFEFVVKPRCYKA